MADTREVQERIRIDKIQKLKTYEGVISTRLKGSIPDKELRAFLERDLKRTKSRIAVLGG